MRHICRVAIGLAASLAFAPAVWAEDAAFDLQIRNHRFEPEALEVPAGQKIELRVHNTDSTAEEFESNDLRREKVVAAGQTISVYVGPLRPGTYEFFGDFNPQTARGRIVAK
jgi:plastocyanin